MTSSSDIADSKSVSVVIPALNEADRIAATIQATRLQSPQQIIVVDGGSDDATIANASGADTVLMSEPGRAIQQNLGASRCLGEAILFLHADCLLGEGAIAQIEEAMRDEGVVAGCLTQVIEDQRLIFRAVAKGNNLRASLMRWAYGDQAIWFRRATFEQLGGFPEVPFMEDLLMMKKLKLQPGQFTRLPATVTTPARHWKKRGVVGQTLMNWRLITLLHLGYSPEQLLKRVQANSGK